MSARALSWAWEQDVPAGEKFLLVAIADQARNDGVMPYGPQAQLAEMTGAKERTVRANLAKLEERGLLSRTAQFEDRHRVPDALRLAVDLEPADIAAGRNGRALHPSSTSTGKQADEGSARQILPLAVDGVPDEMLRDASELLRTKRKVGSRIVTAGEMAVAVAALAEFNRQAGSAFGIGAHLTPLVMRVRERPSWDGSKHVRLVQSAFRVRWWEKSGRGGRTTPAVIYGNERVFEAVAQDAAAEAKGEPVDAVREKRFKRRGAAERQG